jgi:uncharacterized protein (TIGR02996 family)
VKADAETRAEVLAEVREVLAMLKGQAATPPVRFDVPPPATPEKDVLEALRVHHAGATLTLPGGLTVQHAGPTPVMLGLLGRLTYLLGLSGLERQFFEACASGRLPDAWDARLAYADWLEERGDEAGAVRVRKLTPRPGDVTQESLELHVPPARALAEALAARGVETSWMVLPPGAALDHLSEAQMAELGWVRAGLVEKARGEGFNDGWAAAQPPVLAGDAE